MTASKSISCDILVIGSGFAGSLMALCLHQLGYRVCVVERDQHPRFAIGESSTPIADMILRDLSDRYDLPWLKHFSRYGSWQRHYPQITCGLKRGFSYFKHDLEHPFNTDQHHRNELMVAASVSNKQSDTNWLRSDFDAFLVQKLKEYGVTYLDKTEITTVEQKENWKIKAGRMQDVIEIDAPFFVDATGNNKFLNRFLDIKSTDSPFKTRSQALFSHFTDVTPWESYLHEAGIPTHDFPFNADFSALHHLINEGWMWMLRFNDNRTSAGFLINVNDKGFGKDRSAAEQWEHIISGYPSLQKNFRHAKLAKEPGRMIKTGRLQRRLEKAAGNGWAALPHTAGFVDPLHSTGIAHTLCGVEKLLDIFSDPSRNNRDIEKRLYQYEQSVFDELKFIDLLVAGCYNSLHNFEIFSTYTMLYFIAAITYEQERLAGQKPSHFLVADNPEIADIINTSLKELNNITSTKAGERDIKSFRNAIKERIKPFNTAGLLDPSVKNMYRHTAAKL